VPRVIARRFEDLICWQLAFELQREVFAFTATRPAWRDVRYREQIRDSSASATRNTAEGFGRFRPRDFARFMDIAHASLDETKNHLHDGQLRGYLVPDEHDRLVRLCIRALAANSGLNRYLKTCDPNHPLRKPRRTNPEP
jgi:four helix bundle protein